MGVSNPSPSTTEPNIRFLSYLHEFQYSNYLESVRNAQMDVPRQCAEWFTNKLNKKKKEDIRTTRTPDDIRYPPFYHWKIQQLTTQGQKEVFPVWCLLVTDICLSYITPSPGLNPTIVVLQRKLLGKGEILVSSGRHFLKRKILWKNEVTTVILESLQK